MDMESLGMVVITSGQPKGVQHIVYAISMPRDVYPNVMATLPLANPRPATSSSEPETERRICIRLNLNHLHIVSDLHGSLSYPVRSAAHPRTRAVRLMMHANE